MYQENFLISPYYLTIYLSCVILRHKSVTGYPTPPYKIQHEYRTFI